VDGRHSEIAKILISNKALIKAEDAKGITPLMLAVIKKHDAVATLLLNCGANLDCVGRQGLTLLSWAVRQEDEAYEAFV